MFEFIFGPALNYILSECCDLILFCDLDIRLMRCLIFFSLVVGCGDSTRLVFKTNLVIFIYEMICLVFKRTNLVIFNYHYLFYMFCWDVIIVFWAGVYGVSNCLDYLEKKKLFSFFSIFSHLFFFNFS